MRSMVEGLALLSRISGNPLSSRRVQRVKEKCMHRPTGRDVQRSKPKPSPRTDRPEALPHDLPIFPENAPRDEKGEPVVRP